MRTGRKIYRSRSFGRFMQGDGREEDILGDLNSMCIFIEGERKIRNMLLNILCKILSLGSSLLETKNIPVSVGQRRLVKK